MNTVNTISTWTSLILHFLSNFTVPGGKIFVQLLNGWILCTVRRTVTGILPFADPQGRHAHDAFHRFFPDARWSMAGLWRILAGILIKTFYRTGTITLALDDTPQTFKGQGPERAAGLSLWLYSMVWLWYLKQKSSQRYFMVRPWNPLKCRPSFADAIACLRRELWRERIKGMFGNSAVHDKKFEFLLEALAPAA